MVSEIISKIIFSRTSRSSEFSCVFKDTAKRRKSFRVIQFCKSRHEAGLAPLDAIKAATIVPARIFNLENELGTIETGKRADLILVEDNPLESISQIRNTKFVVAGGRMYDCAKLWQSVGFKP